MAKTSIKTPNTNLKCPQCGLKLWRVCWGDFAGKLICRPEMGGCGYSRETLSEFEK